MADASWKEAERRAARMLGGKRTPLSGRNSGHTASDVIHDTLFIEVKYYKKAAIWTLWEKTKKLADKEGKLPVVCMFQPHRKGFLVCVHIDDLASFLESLTEWSESHAEMDETQDVLGTMHRMPAPQISD